jgi:hypothetical protein
MNAMDAPPQRETRVGDRGEGKTRNHHPVPKGNDAESPVFLAGGVDKPPPFIDVETGNPDSGLRRKKGDRERVDHPKVAILERIDVDSIIVPAGNGNFPPIVKQADAEP